MLDAYEETQLSLITSQLKKAGWYYLRHALIRDLGLK